MQKRTLIIILSFIIFQQSFGQDAIAKLKYEEAEESYNKNDYSKSLTKLDEAEKILGKSNSKMLYLRILCQNAIFNIDPYKDFKIIENLRINCSRYLKQNENNNAVIDKFKEVYYISENLKNYPDTLMLFENKISQNKEDNRKKMALDYEIEKEKTEVFKNFVYYEQWAPYIGKSVKELKKSNLWFSKPYYLTDGNYRNVSQLLSGFDNENKLGHIIINQKNIIIGYEGSLTNAKDTNETKDLIEKLSYKFGFEPIHKSIDEYENQYVWQKDGKTIKITQTHQFRYINSKDESLN
jgi:hypothetical protein